MTARAQLVKLLGHEVVVTSNNTVFGESQVRGVLIALRDEPSLTVRHEDGTQSSWPQSFLVQPDLTTDARRVIAELAKYEDEHGHHEDGWPCLAAALDAARAALPNLAASAPDRAVDAASTTGGAT